MTFEWIKILIAAFFEVIWVTGLKNANSLWTWVITVFAIFISFYLLIASGKKLPVGTAYAVFVGLGTAGTVITEMVFFNEPFILAKLILILLLLVGVIGLKIVTEESEDTDEKELTEGS